MSETMGGSMGSVAASGAAVGGQSISSPNIGVESAPGINTGFEAPVVGVENLNPTPQIPTQEGVILGQRPEDTLLSVVANHENPDALDDGFKMLADDNYMETFRSSTNTPTEKIQETPIQQPIGQAELEAAMQKQIIEDLQRQLEELKRQQEEMKRELEKTREQMKQAAGDMQHESHKLQAELAKNTLSQEGVIVDLRRKLARAA